MFIIIQLQGHITLLLENDRNSKEPKITKDYSSNSSTIQNK